jgi:hypothetical protein
VQTQSIKENLQSLHDELKAAVSKSDADAKSQIRTAIAHADAAKAELQARIKADNVKDKASAQKAMDKVQEAARAAKAAIDAKGADIQTHLKQSVAAAKAALDS